MENWQCGLVITLMGLVSFIAGVIFTAKACDRAEKRAVIRKIIQIDGVVYKLVLYE